MVSFVLVVNRGVIMHPIDADALNKKLHERVGSQESDELYEVNLCIIEAPTLDVEPVVHGWWLGKRYDFTKYEYVIVPYDVTMFDRGEKVAKVEQIQRNAGL